MIVVVVTQLYTFIKTEREYMNIMRTNSFQAFIIKNLYRWMDTEDVVYIQWNMSLLLFSP